MRAALFVFPLMLFFLLGIFISIGVYVYRDAKARGMEPALWTLIALLVPSLIGFVIYLIVRTSHSALTCPQCGQRVTAQFTVCPQCGTRLRRTCSKCGTPVESGWRVCPQCATPLPQEEGAVTAPKNKKDSSLGKILVLIIVAPLILIVLSILLYSTSGTQAVSHSSTTTVWDYEEFQLASEGTVAESWLASCDPDANQAYVLHFQEKDPGNGMTRYLVYVPGARGSVDFHMSGGKTLWRSFNRLDVNSFEDGESLVFWIVVDSDRALPLDVYLNGQKMKTILTETDSYPIPACFYEDVDDVDYE